MNDAILHSPQYNPLLRKTLLADAIATGLAGLLLATAATPLADLFGLPETLLRVVGIALLPYAALVMVIGSRDIIARRAAGAVVAANLVWTAASLLLLLSDWVDPNATGTGFVIAQAVLVGGFADAQILALRRTA